MKSNLLCIEPLEARIAPATLVNPTTVTYQDVDGDTVTVKSSKPIFDAANVASVLVFDGGAFGDANASQQQLQSIDLTALADPAAALGASISVTAKAGATGGDGLVNVGEIAANGIDLGSVKIGGDLGRIHAGAGGPAAVKSLVVASLGAFGTSTQAAGGDLSSGISGGVGSIAVRGDFLDANVAITGANGSLGKFTLGGSLRGGAAVASGSLTVAGTIGAVSVKGGIFGMAQDSGSIHADGAIKSVKISGSIHGGDGDDSGAISSSANIGAIFVGGDLLGGGGEDSGVISGGLRIGSVKIAGSMVGGTGEESGSVSAEGAGGFLGSVTVGHDVRGGSGEESAYIHALVEIGGVKIGGSLIGGAGDRSALVYAGSAFFQPHYIKSVFIGGNMEGGVGISSGSIGSAFSAAGSAAALDIGGVIIRGSILGDGEQSASITANDVKSIAIGGDILGAASESGNIRASGYVPKISIGGSVQGSAADSAVLSFQTLGALKIGGSLRGGAEPGAGAISVFGDSAGSISITGSIISGGGEGAGAIRVSGSLGTVAVGGSITGNSAVPVVVAAIGQPGAMTPLALKSLSVKGSVTWLNVLAGFLAGNGPLTIADASIGSVSVAGDWVASSISAGIKPGSDQYFGNNDDVPGTTGHTTGNVSTIAKITIKGQALGTVGGADHFGFVAREIGSLKIGAVTYGFTAAPEEQFAIGATGDFTAREAPLA